MADQPQIVRPEGIEGSELPGPFAVGEYAAKLRARLREFARVQIYGELANVQVRPKRVYFELRDGGGALPCAMWRDDFDKLGLPPGVFADGTLVVAGGGTDYYVGSRTSSPSFSFDVRTLRIAGEGDLLAQIERLRRVLGAEGLFEPQKRLQISTLPRSIGVVTAETGKARDDVLAGLRRRGWAGRLVWAFAPVQDQHAAPRIARALQDLAAVGGVEVIIVARGGGSPTDLLAFSDETLCRTVALLPVPVVASVGHHTDHTLIDDVAAVCCSTPTHAAEAAVPLDVAEARRVLHGAATRLAVHARRAVLDRARVLVRLSRAPAEHVRAERARLHQMLREIRASARGRALARRSRDLGVRATVLSRKVEAARGPERAEHTRKLDALALALAASDPERVVERGYAVVDDGDGNVVTSAAEARAAGRVRLFFRDARVGARIEEE